MSVDEKMVEKMVDFRNVSCLGANVGAQRLSFY